MAMIIQPMPEPVIVVQPAMAQPVMVQPIHQPIIQQTPGPVVMRPPLKDTPGRMRCTCCQQEMVTVTRGVNGALTWTIFATLLIFLIWPFCLIPFCVDACKDIEHSCPNCQNVVYIHKRM
ncbi:hypothetical protein MHYP_G00099570 [Metynnis hypsauchen]